MPIAEQSSPLRSGFSKSRRASIGDISRISALLAAVVLVLVFPVWVRSGEPPQLCSATPAVHNCRAESILLLAKSETVPGQKYHWLFREPSPKEAGPTAEKAAVFETLDREIKEARRLYLAGETENAILKYRSAIDHFESLLDDIPPSHRLLQEVEQRFPVYDELATKILGPANLDPKEEQAGLIFHLMEKRRIFRRNLTLRKAGDLGFFDVPKGLITEESTLLMNLMQVREEVPGANSKQRSEELKSKLSEVRKSMQKSSPRYARLRKGIPPPLAEVRRDLLGPDEMILDFNMFPDRMLVGIITADKATYHQVPINRAEIDKGVFYLQERLREFASGERATFMGHAWKEQCRRTFRTLFGQLPPLPDDKRTVFVIPDRSLWYLPLSATLDPEDRPFGSNRMVSLIPSADMLYFIRTVGRDSQKSGSDKGLLLLESIPWIPEEELKAVGPADATQKKAQEKLSEEEKIERLILTNPVYPKSSDIAVQLQKIFKRSSAWVAQAATMDRFLDQRDTRGDVAVLAVPLAMTDAISSERQPSLFFSPDKQGRRNLYVSALFSVSLGSRLLMLPISWVDVQDKDSPLGEGPLLLATAMFYAGVKMGMVCYSDPNWGAEDPFLTSILKMISQGTAPGRALADYSRELPSGLDTSFTGKPPAWAGWIVMGDPR